MVTPLAGAGVVLCTTGVFAEGAGATVPVEVVPVVCACTRCADESVHKSAAIKRARKIFFPEVFITFI
jgi:hypothetical protein